MLASAATDLRINWFLRAFRCARRGGGEGALAPSLVTAVALASAMAWRIRPTAGALNPDLTRPDGPSRPVDRLWTARSPTGTMDERPRARQPELDRRGPPGSQSHQRSYLFLLGSRFFILMATGFFMNLNILYLQRTHGLTGGEQGAWILAGLAMSVVATALGTIPGAKISDRVGRKPVIHGSTLLGAIGMTIIGLAPDVPVAMIGIALVGLAAGAFLAVDWALMTDIIPKASAGRYMGLSNIVEATNGPIATSVGGLMMYLVGLSLGQAVGARAAMLAAVVMFALGAALLSQVQEPRRDRSVDVVA